MQVKFFGSAKKSFAKDSIHLTEDNITITDLLDILSAKKPKDTPNLDIANSLIAVNGVDSSAIDDKDTILRSSDIISIIPVIHGGMYSNNETYTKSKIFTILKTCVLVYPVFQSNGNYVDYTFLDSLRSAHPNLVIQAISCNFILSYSHIKKIVTVSLEAKKRQVLLSSKLETDILLRFAGTTQISRAISDLGIKPKTSFVLIALGSKSNLVKIIKYLDNKFYDNNNLDMFDKANESFLKKYFKISQKQLNCNGTVSTNASKKVLLEDILQEKSVILF